MTRLERFMQKVAMDPSGCWLWTGGLYSNGYGRFWNGERVQLAHRWAYEHFVGPIPEGLVIDHVHARGCTHRHCVNPDHLEPVTNRENLLRGETLPARQVLLTHCPRNHPYDDANTYRDPAGTRRCRECARAYQARRRSAA